MLVYYVLVVKINKLKLVSACHISQVSVDMAAIFIWQHIEIWHLTQVAVVNKHWINLLRLTSSSYTISNRKYGSNDTTEGMTPVLVNSCMLLLLCHTWLIKAATVRPLILTGKYFLSLFFCGCNFSGAVFTLIFNFWL